MHFVDERHHVRLEAVDDGVALDLLAGEQAPHAETSIGDPLERVRHLVERTAEAALVNEDQGLDGGTGVSEFVDDGVSERTSSAAPHTSS